MARKRAGHRRFRQDDRRSALQPARRVHAGQQAGHRGLHIALDAGHLPRKKEVRPPAEGKVRVEQPRRIEKRIAVHHAVAHELRVAQPRYHAEHALLLRKLQVRLESDEVEQRLFRILGAQLHHGPRAAAGARVAQADRLQWAEADRVVPALRHHLDRHAALVDLRVHHVEIVDRRALRRNERLVKRLVFLFVHRAVDVIVVAAAVARGREAVLHVEAFARDDRRGGVKKAEPAAAERGDPLGERVARQRAARDHHDAVRRDLRDLARHDLDIRVRAQPLGRKRRKAVAVDRQRAARRHAARVRAGDEQRAHAAHFLFQQARRAVDPRGLQ